MNLVIDIGNSRTKVAIFSRQEMVKSFILDELSTEKVKELRREFPDTENVILSSVASIHPSLNTYLKRTFSYFLELNVQTPVPIRNNYRTPDTLGPDRLAAAIGARVLFPDKDLLVIDAGTAVTYDLTERNGTFMGGNISPDWEAGSALYTNLQKNYPW